MALSHLFRFSAFVTDFITSCNTGKSPEVKSCLFLALKISEWAHISCEMFAGGLVRKVVYLWWTVVNSSVVSEVVSTFQYLLLFNMLRFWSYIFRTDKWFREAELTMMYTSNVELLRRTRVFDIRHNCCYSLALFWHCCIQMLRCVVALCSETRQRETVLPNGQNFLA